MYQINDLEVKKDFREILKRDFQKDRRYNLESWVDNWYNHYKKLTKNDNDLKIIFILAMDKYRSVPRVIVKFKLAEKTGDYSKILAA